MGRDVKWIWSFGKGRDPLEHLVLLGGRGMLVTLKWILKTLEVMMWVEFAWFRVVSQGLL